MRVEIDQAKQLLLDGKLVAFPTETVYGLGALATNESAVTAVYDIKHRPHDNPLICHFAWPSQIKQYTTNIPTYWDVLVSHFSPGPVSYLLSCKDDSLHHATRWSQKVLCRIPNHPLTLQLLEQLDQPVVWPSVNPSWQPSATSASMVEEYFGDMVAVIDGGSSWIGLESTIIDCTHEDHITILRPWQIGVVDIETVLERGGHRHVLVYGLHPVWDDQQQTIPWAKYRHYSPQTIIFKTHQRDPVHDRWDIAIIWPTELLERIETTEVTHRIDLGSVYTPSIIAHNLYHHLHHLDSLWVRHAYLLMWKMGDSGIEQAITDRLEKIGEWREE
jgi:L-threonylcarbamoyladenylate synthase